MRIVVAFEFDAIVVGDAPVALGLGAQLPEPDPDLFLETFWNGGDVTVGLESRTGAGGFGDLLRESGFAVEVIAPASDRYPSVPDAFRSIGGSGPLVLIESSRAPYVNDDDAYTVVLGIGPTLPILVALPARTTSLLDPDRAGLPGVLSPYDLTRTLASQLTLEVPAAMPGAFLTEVPNEDAQGIVIERTNRFRHDLAWKRPVTGTSVAIIVLACLFGGIVALRGRSRAGARGWIEVAGNSSAAAIIGAFVGSLAATLLPIGEWPARVGVVLAFALGAVVVARSASLGRRIAIALATMVLVVLPALTVVAEVLGDGEPALSLWPSPLEASRASGLLNGYAVLLIGTTLTLRAAGALSDRGFILLGVVVTAVIALPWLGANYGGGMLAAVAIGGALAIERSGRLRMRDLVVIGAVAIVVLGVALALDVGGATHGGRFLTALREDGPAVLGDAIRGRIDTSAVVIGRFGWIAWLGFVGMLPILAWLVLGVLVPDRVRVFATRSLAARGACGGLILAALAALVIEDTGFLTCGGLLGFVVANAIREEVRV